MNTETKHTPGPWRVSEYNVKQVEVIADKEMHIAFCSNSHAGHANACLIASAPDMAKEIAQLRADKAELVEGLCNISLQIHNQLTAHERTPFLTLAEKNARNLIAKHSKV